MADPAADTDQPLKPRRASVDLVELQAALAAASRRNEALTALVADLAARVYSLEDGLGLRQNGSQKLEALRFMGGATRATYELVRERVLAGLTGTV